MVKTIYLIINEVDYHELVQKLLDMGLSSYIDSGKGCLNYNNLMPPPTSLFFTQYNSDSDIQMKIAGKYRWIDQEQEGIWLWNHCDDSGAIYDISYSFKDGTLKKYFNDIKKYVKKQYIQNYDKKYYIGFNWNEQYEKKEVHTQFFTKAFQKKYNIDSFLFEQLIEILKANNIIIKHRVEDIRKEEMISYQESDLLFFHNESKLKTWRKKHRFFYYPESEAVFAFVYPKKHILIVLVDENIYNSDETKEKIQEILCLLDTFFQSHDVEEA